MPSMTKTLNFNNHIKDDAYDIVTEVVRDILGPNDDCHSDNSRHSHRSHRHRRHKEEVDSEVHYDPRYVQNWIEQINRYTLDLLQDICSEGNFKYVVSSTIVQKTGGGIASFLISECYLIPFKKLV